MVWHLLISTLLVSPAALQSDCVLLTVSVLCMLEGLTVVLALSYLKWALALCYGRVLSVLTGQM